MNQKDSLNVVTTLVEYRRSLFGRPDLFCNKKTLLLLHLKQVYKEFSRASCDFSSCLMKRFIFSLAESKTGCSKIGSMFVSIFLLCTFEINKMDKTSKKVTKDKDPKHAETGRRSRENFMKKMKENILNKKGGRDTTNSSNETTSATNNSSNESTSVTNTTTIRSIDTYVYGVGILAVLAIGVCVFFGYSTFQPKKIINEKQDQPPKRIHVCKKP